MGSQNLKPKARIHKILEEELEIDQSPKRESFHFRCFQEDYTTRKKAMPLPEF